MKTRQTILQMRSTETTTYIEVSPKPIHYVTLQDVSALGTLTNTTVTTQVLYKTTGVFDGRTGR